MRCHSSLLVALSVSALVLALPVYKGDIHMADNRHCEPPDRNVHILAKKLLRSHELMQENMK